MPYIIWLIRYDLLSMSHNIAVVIEAVWIDFKSSQRDSSKTSSSNQSNPIECYRNQNAKDCDPLKPLLMERLSKDNKDFWIKFWSTSFDQFKFTWWRSRAVSVFKRRTVRRYRFGWTEILWTIHQKSKNVLGNHPRD